MHNQRKKKLDWFNTTFMGIFTFGAIASTIGHIMLEGFNPWLIIPFVFFYFLTGLSITAGYHRLFSHRAYKANKWVQFVFLVFGAGAFENSVLKWASDHRRHHTHCDEDLDPYNISRGFWWAHIGWILIDDGRQKESHKFVKDLGKNKLILWQHKYYVWIGIFSGIILPTLAGWALGSPLGGFALAGLARIVFVHHMTFFINSLCHIVGSQPFNDQNTARDSYWMAFFTYGEGFHNFHHYFQSDYRNGIRWFDFDPTKWLINTLSYFGQVTALKQASDEEILKAKLSMQAKQALAKDQFAMAVEEKLSHINALIDRLSTLKKEIKMQAKLKSSTAKLSMQVQEIKRELNSSLANWKIMIKSMPAAA